MRKYIEWREFYSVGEESLDAQHKQVLSIINELYDAMESGKEHAERQRLLERLVKYTMTHFQHEEQLMQASGYPDFVNHKHEHDQMRSRTLGLRESLDLVTAHDLLRFLKEWWTRHIQSEDQCYVPYVAAAARQRRSAAAPAQAVGPVDWRGQTTTY
jgi:hemerythrin